MGWFIDNLLEIVALFVSFMAITLVFFKDFIHPLIFKPKITLKGGNDEECIEDAKSPGGVDSRWVRLKIRNKDSFFSKPAKNCYIKLLSIKNEKNKRITPFNPVPLTWNHYDTSPYDKLTGGKHNLSVGEYHLIDLVHEKSNIDHQILCFKVPLPRKLGENAPAELGPGKYTFILGVYGDNFKSLKLKFKVGLSKEYGHIKFI